MKLRIAFLSVLFLFLAGAAMATPTAGEAQDPGAATLRATWDLGPVPTPAPDVSALQPAPGLGPQSLSDRVLARTAGAGPTSDFLCGAATGAGFALALTGVGAGPGLALAGAGMACAMFF